MRKIVNKSDADQYFKQINEIIDEYITKWKIRPTEIKSYFKKNMDKFLERVGLSDVEGIIRVVNDVIDHRVNMELDNVMKFENFNLFEGVINIGKTTIQHEKILADYYNTSLGHIEIIDNDIHLYSVKDFNEEVKSIIFNDDELLLIYKKIEDDVLENAKNKLVSISEIDNINIETPIKFQIIDFIDEKKFREVFKKNVDKKQILLIIKNIVCKRKNINFNLDKIQYKGEYKGFHIWETRKINR